MLVQRCSNYTFRQVPRSYSWTFARERCRRTQDSDLVSMESSDEWEYLKSITQMKRGRWYIGLQYSTSKWCWLSNTSNCINQSDSIVGKWRWYQHEPNNLGDENCVEMYWHGRYNNIACKSSFFERGIEGGYICERKVGKEQQYLT